MGIASIAIPKRNQAVEIQIESAIQAQWQFRIVSESGDEMGMASIAIPERNPSQAVESRPR
jgi:hypothetical protein